MRPSLLGPVALRPLALVAALLPALAAAQQPLDFALLGTYRTGVYDSGAAEIAAYHAPTRRLFFVNAAANTVSILDVANPAAPTFLLNLDLAAFGGGANSVAVSPVLDVVAVAVQATVPQDSGRVAVFTTAGALIGARTVCALPDAVTFSPDGFTIVASCEGEPNGAYTVDPEGGVAIVRLLVPAGGGTPGISDVDLVRFNAFNAGGPRAGELPAGVRIYGPGASVAQDLEPEYAAISPDGLKAYVTLQENNALAVVDLATATVDRIVALGFKNHNAAGNGLDASDQDGPTINIRPWPVLGMYQPDGIAAFAAGGRTYLVTANEGDVREYAGLNEAARVSAAAVVLDPTVFPDAATLKLPANLGRLNVTTRTGDTDGDGDLDAIFAFGGRSVSVWDAAAGTLVWDSGDGLERLTAERYPTRFNASNTNNTLDNRSDDKGPEPEGVVLGDVNGRRYAFAGLERIGGVVAYDVSDPAAPGFAGYVNNRNFAAATNTEAAGDLGPEGLVFIPAGQSPTGVPLLVTANEISGTVSFFEVRPRTTPAVEPGVGGDAFALHAVVPNPVRGRAEVRFDLPADADVALVVVDVLGREVVRVVPARLAAGAGHSIAFDADGLAPGAYVARLTARTSGRTWTATTRLVRVR